MTFDSYAAYYDTLYREKDYDREIDFVLRLSKAETGDSILDLGCGTGGHAIPLARRGYHVTGVDLSEPMLASARSKATGLAERVEFVQGDIRSKRLGRTFGLVLSMFAVMSYQTTNEDFFDALCTARAHLERGRLFIFDAWYGPAVLASRPETRVKEIVQPKERLIRIANPVLNTLNNTVLVSYQVLAVSGSQVLSASQEGHLMRFFFAPEVEFFARQAGFRVAGVWPFMNATREPTDQDWNVTWLLRAA